MNELSIKVEHVSKEYRLGAIGGATLRGELQSKFAKLRGKEDPNLNAIYGYLDNLAFEPRITAWFEIRDLIADYLERCTLEHKDPKIYCAEMERDINAMLKHVTDTDDNKELGNVD